MSSFSFVGSHYTYDVAPPYLVFDEYSGLFTCTLSSTFVSGRPLMSHVSPLDASLINDAFFITSLHNS